jgi:hypothetical protein
VRTSADAERRAAALLPRVLSPRERATFYETGRIVITGSEGGMYEILRHGYVGNVVTLQTVLVGGAFAVRARAGWALCAHPMMYVMSHDGQATERLPPSDAYIAQILVIKADEKRFLRTANIYSYGPMY